MTTKKIDTTFHEGVSDDTADALSKIEKTLLGGIHPDKIAVRAMLYFKVLGTAHLKGESGQDKYVLMGIDESLPVSNVVTIVMEHEDFHKIEHSTGVFRVKNSN